MGCGCGSKTKIEYIYTSAGGEQQTHPTLVAAKAAKIRAGNTGSIREQVKK